MTMKSDENVLNVERPIDQFIAYIDILGYTEMISARQEKLLVEIRRTVSLFKQLAEHLNDKEIDIKFKMFSDNIIMSTKKDFSVLMKLTGFLQSELAKENIFMRGALSYGNILVNDDYIFGQGLVNAYKLESKVAVYPRIIIDKSYYLGILNLIPEVNRSKITIDNIIYREVHSKQVICDFDGCTYVDYLSIYYDYISSLTGKDITFEDLMEFHRKNVLINLMNSKENIKVGMKYGWVMNYHNLCCNTYNIQQYLIKEGVNQ